MDLNSPMMLSDKSLVSSSITPLKSFLIRLRRITVLHKMTRKFILVKSMSLRMLSLILELFLRLSKRKLKSKLRSQLLLKVK
jgi:hypothetical protein